MRLPQVSFNMAIFEILVDLKLDLPVRSIVLKEL
jgi:hypothetical protein